MDTVLVATQVLAVVGNAPRACSDPPGWSFDGNILVLHFAIGDLVLRMVQADLHANHIAVVVPGYRLEVLRPDSAAFHSTGYEDLEKRRKEPEKCGSPRGRLAWRDGRKEKHD